MSSYTAPGNVQFNYAQLEGIWLQAGGQPGAAPIAAAVAMAESGGSTTATNQDSNGTVDRGLWQINSVHGAQSTYDVMGNARAAVAISNNGQNWAPWTTYNNGAYQQYLQAGVTPDTSAPINGTNAAVNQNTASLTGNADLVGAFGIPGLPSILDPMSWFGTAAGNASAAIVKFFMQGLIMTVINPIIQISAGIMGIGAGAAMVVVGFYIVAHNTETGQAVERGAGKAAQAGLMIAAPETRAMTSYQGAGGKITNVTQSRRAAGAVNVGGRRVQYRPAQVTTTVASGNPPPPNLPPPPSTGQQLRNESYGYAQGGESQRTTSRRPYGYGQKMGPPRPTPTRNGNGKK